MHANWSLTLTHHEDSGNVRESLTCYGDEIGDLIGEVMHSAVRWEGEHGNGPLYTLMKLLNTFNGIYCTYRSKELRMLEQMLMQDDVADDCSEEEFIAAIKRTLKIFDKESA